MLKSEEAFNAFLDTLPNGYEGEPAVKELLLKAFIAGGEFGAQFAIDEFKRRASTSATGERNG